MGGPIKLRFAKELEKSKVPTGDLHRFEVHVRKAYVVEMEEFHFHFDSAVMLPDFEGGSEHSATPHKDRITALAILRAVYLHARDNPSRKLLIAGHTDRSGDADYNVQLSQLRAESVRHVLEGNRADWVTLVQGKHKVEDYQLILKWIASVWGWGCDPGAVDNTLGAQTHNAIRSFQRRYNTDFSAAIGVDGDMGPQTWGAIFDVYVRYLEDLIDADGETLASLRGKIQYVSPGRRTVGCGENFPLTPDRIENVRSAIDRRVEAIFFDPGEEPALDCHPGAGKCKPVLCELHFPSMYQFIAIPVAPAHAAMIEIVFDQDDDLVVATSDPPSAFADVGWWDRAFDTTTGNLRNNAPEDQNFVGSDNRRFYLRIKDLNATGPVTAKLRTTFPGGADDDAPADQDITCIEREAGSHELVSHGLMLVTDATDQAQATTPGAGATGPGGAGQKDHRLRRITVSNTHPLDNEITVEYTPVGASHSQRRTFTVFDRSPIEQRRRIRVHLINVRASVGGAPSLTAARRDLIIRTIQSIYAVGGIFAEVDEIQLDPPASCIGWATRYPTDPQARDPAVEGFDFAPGTTDLAPSPTQTALIQAVRALPNFDQNDVWVVCVSLVYSAPIPAAPGPGLTPGGGEAFPDAWTAAGGIARSFAFIGDSSGVTEFGYPHEVTHITTNLRNDAGGHYDLGPAAAVAPTNLEAKNLMHRFFLPNNQGVLGPKRIWNENRTNTSRGFVLPPQIDAIRGSRFIRPY